MWRLAVAFSSGGDIASDYGILAFYWGPDRAPAETFTIAFRDLENHSELSVYQAARARMSEVLLSILEETSLIDSQPAAYSEICKTCIQLDLSECVFRIAQFVQSDALDRDIPGEGITITGKITLAFVERRPSNFEAKTLATALSTNATIGSGHYIPELVSERLRLSHYSPKAVDPDIALLEEIKEVENLVQAYVDRDTGTHVEDRRSTILEAIEDSVGLEVRNKAEELLYSIKKPWENDTIPETPVIERLKRVDLDDFDVSAVRPS
jgi:hypothetical protein